MSDNLNLLDDVLSAGYTAPRLVQKATEENRTMLDAAIYLRARLLEKGLPVRLVTGKYEMSQIVYAGAGEGIFDDIRRGPRSIRVKFTVGKFPVSFVFRSRYSDGDVDMSTSISLGSFREEIPQELWIPLIAGETVTLPVTNVDEITPLAQLSMTCDAPAVREMLFNSIRNAFLNEQRDSDVLLIHTTDKTTAADMAQFCSLFVNKKLKSTCKASERHEALDLPMNDLGIKNLDHLAVVIYVAAYAFRMNPNWQARAELSEMNAWLQDVLIREVADALGTNLVLHYTAAETWTKDLLCKFIEHLGGTIPKTICFRR